MSKSNISVIIPVHSLSTEEDKELLNLAISSVEKQKVLPSELLIVIAKSEKDKLEMPDSKLNVRVIINSGDTSFQSQLNLGVASAKSEWITFLEYDDELSSIWLDNATKYIEKKSDVGMFIPIVVGVKPDGAFLGFTNEVLWANQFSNEMGILDLDILKDYQNFSIDGMVIKKSVYENLGGLKSSIKLSFITEFLMRLTYNGIRIMTIPKIGYKHVDDREGSLFNGYKTMDPEEIKFWQELATREYFHTTDRKIQYEKTEV